MPPAGRFGDEPVRAPPLRGGRLGYRAYRAYRDALEALLDALRDRSRKGLVGVAVGSASLILRPAPRPSRVQVGGCVRVA